MAELRTDSQPQRAAGLAWAQFEAIAFLRWRIFANGFRRRGGAPELIGRLLLFPAVGFLVLVPAVLAGFFSWYFAMHGALGQLSLVFWATFAFAQLLNLNLGQPGTTFDPSELIRFPLSLRNYILVRLCFGLLSPANLVVAMMSAAIFIGVTADRPLLWFWTSLATTAFALTNVLFSRMIFAWVDRWLSTRRAREIFTSLIFAASLFFQYLNVTYNPAFQQSHHRVVTSSSIHHAQALSAKFHPWLQWTPPELATSAILAAARHTPASSLLYTITVLLYALLFLSIYGLRMQTEYRGENLSDTANAVRSIKARSPLRKSTDSVSTAEASLPLGIATAAPRRGLLPPSLGPLLTKELLVLRRNTGLLYGVVAPMVMVFLFAGRVSWRGGSEWVLLLAVGYALLGLAPMSYNSFGLEGPGAQFYFIAPLPLREVFFAKNLMHFLLALFEVGTVIAIVGYLTGKLDLRSVLFVVFWAAATLLLNTALGNLRSVAAPKKVSPGKSMNRAQSQLSVWIAIGVLVAGTGLGAAFQFASLYFHQPWLRVALAMLLAALSVFSYIQSLGHIEEYALRRREMLLEELGKKT